MRTVNLIVLLHEDERVLENVAVELDFWSASRKSEHIRTKGNRNEEKI